MEWSLERSPFPDGLQPVPALRAAAAPFPCHSCQGLQKALNPRAEQQNERLMKNLKVRQNRNEGLKEKTNKNTSTKIPLVPAAPCSSVLPSKALLICGALLVFHNLSCPWVMATSQMWPALTFDGMWSAWQELFYWGQDCLQISSAFWKWVELQQQYSCLAGCLPSHVDCREAVSINLFSVSQPQLAGMFMGRCCRRVFMTGNLQKKEKGAKETCLLEQHLLQKSGYPI